MTFRSWSGRTCGAHPASGCRRLGLGFRPRFGRDPGAVRPADFRQIAEALAVARDIEQPYYRAPTLSAIANAYAGAGDTASAFALFKEALADIPAIPVAGGLRLARHAVRLGELADPRAPARDRAGGGPAPGPTPGRVSTESATAKTAACLADRS